MKTSAIVIRPARPADLAQIELLELACFRSDPWPRQSFESFIGRSGVLFIVAEDPERDGEVAGYGVLIQAMDEGELLNLAVAPSSRRRGVGSAMLGELLHGAAERGIRTVYLEVRESNAAARGLYESRGFVEVGRRRSYYQRPAEDALILQRVEP